MATTQVTVTRQVRQRRPAEEVTDTDPRPGTVRDEWSWRSATALRDATTFWGLR